ncbi:MAG: hypothetical protein AAGJ31_12350 [Verrucomicrobiota bacterium]
MKSIIRITWGVVLATLSMGTVQASEPFTFTSADGSKTMKAEILEYFPSTGMAKIKTGGRQLRVNVNAFDPEDLATFQSWYQETQAGRRIMVYFDETSDKSSSGATRENKAGFVINVRNNGEMVFDDLEVRYQVYYKQDAGSVGKTAKFTAGKAELGSLKARQTMQVATDPVSLKRASPMTIGGT